LAGRGDDLVLGAFLLLEPLGEGGMGEVFKARAHDGARVVALKRLRVDRLTPDQQRRFRREAKIAAQLDHANSVRGVEAGEANGSCYLVMEYIEGTDLARLVKRQGPLAVGMACDYARQAALGLQYAHERGLVHRDVKPSNLLLTVDGASVKVADLGLARP